jgi:hypothetical protein
MDSVMRFKLEPALFCSRAKLEEALVLVGQAYMANLHLDVGAAQPQTFAPPVPILCGMRVLTSYDLRSVLLPQI